LIVRVHHLPVFVHAVSVVPCGPDVEWAEQKPCDRPERRVYPGADGQFTLYEDAGENHAYEKGQRSEITFKWDDARQELTIGDRQGPFPEMLDKRTFMVTVVRPGKGTGVPLEAKSDQTVTYEGTTKVVRFSAPSAQ
jgi:alpha-D-xyloside xylohydrolase